MIQSSRFHSHSIIKLDLQFRQLKARVNSFPCSLNLGTLIRHLATKTYLQAKTKTSANTKQSRIFQIGMVHLVNSVVHPRDYLKSRILTSLVKGKHIQKSSTHRKLFQIGINSCKHHQDHLRQDLDSSAGFKMEKTYLRSSKATKVEAKNHLIEEDLRPIASYQKQGLTFCKANSCQVIFYLIEAQVANRHQQLVLRKEGRSRKSTQAEDSCKISQCSKSIRKR